MQKGFLHTVFFYNKPGGETVKLRRNSGGFGTIAGTLIRFSLPLILSGVLQQLYNWADAFIVGNVEGELALAAIGATGTVVGFCLMILTGFTLGLAILFAQRFGAGETDFLPKLLSTFTFLLGLAGLGLAAAGAMPVSYTHLLLAQAEPQLGAAHPPGVGGQLSFFVSHSSP